MNKYILLLSICAGTFLSGQIKVGENHETIDPAAVLEVESTGKGFLPPRLTSEQRDGIANPAEGLLIYNTDSDCLNLYSGTEWFPVCGISELIGDTEYAIITATPTGHLVHGIDVNDPEETELLPSESLYVVVITPGPYEFTATSNGVTFTASGEFTSTGGQTVVLTATGTPENFGTHAFALGDFSFERKTYVPDRRYKEITLQGQDSDGNGGTEARHHRFIYESFVSTTGKVWLADNLGAHYNQVGHPAFNPEAVPTAFNDNLASGNSFQWGRYSDGHELTSWDGSTPTSVNGTTPIKSDTDDPGHNQFIIQGSNWRVSANNELWQGVNGVNNPCPSGFRVPSVEDFATESTAYGITNRNTAFASPFRFVSGALRHSTGAIYTNDSYMYYMTNITGQFDSNTIYYRFLSGSQGTYDSTKTMGMLVRCVKD